MDHGPGASITAQTSVEEARILQNLARQAYSGLPVYRKEIDEIVLLGYVRILEKI